MGKSTADDFNSDSTTKSHLIGDQAPENLEQPPPAYTEAPSQETPGNLVFPPLPHHAQAPSLTLHIWYESFRKNDIRILDAENGTALYNVKLQLRNPQMTIGSTSTNASIAKVTFHVLKTRIDTTIHNSPVTIISRGILKNGFTFSSPALGNRVLTWTVKSRNLDLECSDDSGIRVARLHLGWSLRKTGKIEIFGAEVARGAVMEEIMVTGLALMEYYLGLATVMITVA